MGESRIEERQTEGKEIMNASVKVMRSYDYCHFEICLSEEVDQLDNVDALRKEAARLADKAVEQYKTAKSNQELIASDAMSLRYAKDRHDAAIKSPEAGRSERDKADIRRYQDYLHRNRPIYDYQDEFDEPEFEDEDDSF